MASTARQTVDVTVLFEFGQRGVLSDIPASDTVGQLKLLISRMSVEGMPVPAPHEQMVSVCGVRA